MPAWCRRTWSRSAGTARCWRDIAAPPRNGGRPPPSSECRLHPAISAARPEAGAVVHTHSPFATAVSCARQGLPPFHYMIALGGGGDIRCSGYATFGTQELAASCLAALDGRKAALLANHGAIAIGKTLAGARTL